MGSPLGFILADIFMVELKSNLVPNLHQHLERYVAITLTMLRGNKMEHVLLILNSCQRNMKFTYEKKINSRLPIFRCSIHSKL